MNKTYYDQHKSNAIFMPGEKILIKTPIKNNTNNNKNNV
jgi:hypothetical protein